MTIHCLSCGVDIEGKRLLELGQFSWPEMQTFGAACSTCDSGLHIQAREGRLVQLKIVSAPGPDWDEVSAESIQGLTVRADPGFLHILAYGNHYEFGAR